MRKICVLLAVVCVVVGCQSWITAESSAAVQMGIEGSKKDVIFKFVSPALDKPLVITSDPEADKGSIFFETVKGRTWLRGEPVRKSAGNGGFSGQWNFSSGHQVSVSIVPDGQDYVVSLSSKGGPDVLKWGFNLDAVPDEYFTGLFERTVDGSQEKSWQEGITHAMNLHGQTVDMIIKPTLSMYAPFYISSRGYGLFVYGTWPGHYDFCKEKNNLVKIGFEGPSLSFRIYTSKSPVEIVKAHSLETGPTILPPRWAFTPWRWRDNHTNRKTYYDGTPVNAPYNSEVIEDILMMEALDIPCGVYWVDRPWAVGPKGYDDFKWDTKRIPNPEQMIKWLESKNIRFLLWIAPWVMGDMAEEALEKDYNLKGQTKHQQTRVLVDFTNPDAVKWWQKGLSKVLKQGVKGFKLDRAEEVVPARCDIKVWDGRTTRENRNDYPVQYVRAVHEITRKVCGDDFVLIPRAGYSGSSKYSGFWGGDIGSPPEGLRTAIIALLRCSVMGYPIWGSDTGGYWHGDLDREGCARWLGFSCFSPIMEVGPTEDRGLWDMKKEPHYDAELIAVWRLYAKIHDGLADYSYNCAKEARRTGMPIARPLFLIYPEQKKAWEDWQTFLYGPDILVSAIWSKNKDKHSLYLPAGEKWRDAWQPEKVYEGGRVVTVSTPFHKIPVFIREGSKLNIANMSILYKESLEIAKNKPDLKKLEKTIR